MTAIAPLHPFEEAGLGIGPFRCLGVEERADRETNQPLGSCNYCSTGIRYCFVIRSADGKRFVVGSDCVRRTYGESAGDQVVIEVRRLERKLARDKRETKRAAAWSKLAARIDAARHVLAAHPELFIRTPHPHAGLASHGKTLRDYYEWTLRNGGMDGRTGVCRVIESRGE